VKIRWIIISYSIISILGLMLLLSRENIFVVMALLLALLLLGHRELWSLIRYRQLPVIDERVRDNLTSAMRLTGIFFFIASIILILLMHFDVFENTPASLIISGLLVIIGIMYVITYYYYDRVQPNLGMKSMRLLKIFLAAAALCLSSIALAIVLHNMVSALLGFEDAFFFILALLIAPGILVISLLGSFVIYIQGLFGTSRHGDRP